MERKTRKRPSYSIAEKNRIVKDSLEGRQSVKKLAGMYDVTLSTSERWIVWVQVTGSETDLRGKRSKGRPKKEQDLESLSKAELIERIRMLKDIKQATACPRRQKKSTG